MTLVPIIYTSLLIFSAVLLIVVLVSYISYKTRASKNLSPSDRIRQETMMRGTKYVTAVPRVQLSPSPTIMVLPTIQKAEPVQPKENQYTQRKVYGAAGLSNAQSALKAEKLNSRREAALRESREINARSRSSYGSIRDRIEIMNSSDFPRPQNRSYNNDKRERRTNDLSDYGLLHFYFDGNDNQLSRANTMELRQAL